VFPGREVEAGAQIITFQIGKLLHLRNQSAAFLDYDYDADEEVDAETQVLQIRPESP